MGLLKTEALPVCWHCAISSFDPIGEDRLPIGEYDQSFAPPRVNGICRGARAGKFILLDGDWEKLNKRIKNHRISSQSACNIAKTVNDKDEEFELLFSPK
jgi:hypothetical protein